MAVYPEKLQALLEKHQDAEEELDGVQRDIDDLLEKGNRPVVRTPIGVDILLHPSRNPLLRFCWSRLLKERRNCSFLIVRD